MEEEKKLLKLPEMARKLLDFFLIFLTKFLFNFS